MISPHGTIWNNFTLHISFPSEVNGFSAAASTAAANHQNHHLLVLLLLLYAGYLYLYLWENYVPREYTVAAILLLLFMILILLVSVLNLLFLYISTFWSMCAVPNMAVFWSSLTSCFRGILLRYFLNYFELLLLLLLLLLLNGEE